MDWVETRRRGPEWQQGWTGQALSSVSAPPLPLVTVFTIVVFLLSLSHYAAYKEMMQYTMLNFKILLFLAPIFLVFLLRSSLLSGVGWLNFWSSPQQGRQEARARGVAAYPWGMALLLVALLLLVSFQSSFQSRWFLFGGSD